MRYYIENIQWADGTDLPTHVTVEADNQDAISETLLNTYGTTPTAFDIVPKLTVSMTFGLSREFELHDVCQELSIHPSDIESFTVTYLYIEIDMKNGDHHSYDLTRKHVPDLAFSDADYEYALRSHTFTSTPECYYTEIDATDDNQEYEPHTFTPSGKLKR